MKRSILIGITLATMGGISYFSAVLGYFLASNQHIARQAPVEAYHNINTLESLRRGNASKAINMLEGQLDTQIFYHSTFNKDIDNWLDWYEIYSGEKRADSTYIMIAVAKYRKKHPTKSSHSAFTKQINEHLQRYKQ